MFPAQHPALLAKGKGNLQSCRQCCWGFRASPGAGGRHGTTITRLECHIKCFITKAGEKGICQAHWQPRALTLWCMSSRCAQCKGLMPVLSMGRLEVRDAHGIPCSGTARWALHEDKRWMLPTANLGGRRPTGLSQVWAGFPGS